MSFLFGGGGSHTTSTSTNTTNVGTQSTVNVAVPIDLSPVEQLAAVLSGVTQSVATQGAQLEAQTVQSFSASLDQANQVQIIVAVLGVAAALVFALVAHKRKGRKLLGGIL